MPCNEDGKHESGKGKVREAARAKFATGASSYRGVGWLKNVGTWKVQISNFGSGKREWVGFFDDETEAALAYDKCVCAACHAALRL